MLNFGLLEMDRIGLTPSQVFLLNCIYQAYIAVNVTYKLSTQVSIECPFLKYSTKRSIFVYTTVKLYDTQMPTADGSVCSSNI